MSLPGIEFERPEDQAGEDGLDLEDVTLFDDFKPAALPRLTTVAETRSVVHDLACESKAVVITSKLTLRSASALFALSFLVLLSARCFAQEFVSSALSSTGYYGPEKEFYVTMQTHPTASSSFSTRSLYISTENGTVTDTPTDALRWVTVGNQTKSILVDDSGTMWALSGNGETLSRGSASSGFVPIWVHTFSSRSLMEIQAATETTEGTALCVADSVSGAIVVLCGLMNCSTLLTLNVSQMRTIRSCSLTYNPISEMILGFADAVGSERAQFLVSVQRTRAPWITVSNNSNGTPAVVAANDGSFYSIWYDPTLSVLRQSSIRMRADGTFATTTIQSTVPTTCGILLGSLLLLRTDSLFGGPLRGNTTLFVGGSIVQISDMQVKSCQMLDTSGVTLQSVATSQYLYSLVALHSNTVRVRRHERSTLAVIDDCGSSAGIALDWEAREVHMIPDDEGVVLLQGPVALRLSCEVWLPVNCPLLESAGEHLFQRSGAPTSYIQALFPETSPRSTRRSLVIGMK